MNRSTAAQLLDQAMAHQRAGRLAEAESLCRQAIATESASAAAHNQLGIALGVQGKSHEAMTSFARAVELDPRLVSAYFNLANALGNLGQYQAAEQACRKGLEIAPTNAMLHNNLARALLAQGKIEAATAAAIRAARIQPALADAHYNLGLAHALAGRRAESLAALERAVGLRPDHAPAQLALAQRLRELGRLGEALDACRRAIAHHPNYADAHNAAGTVLQTQGRADQAIAAYRRAMELSPANRQPHSNLLLAMHYLEQPDPRTVFEEHRQWARRHANVPRFGDHPNDRDPDRRLRIGYVSPDFRQHSVAHFIEPVLRSHDNDRFEILCYSDEPAPDATTQRLREQASAWRDVHAMSDDRLADLVREDHVDILVELAGHTARNRLMLLARKPAPVQVTYLGYPDTTGIDAIDYRLTDSLADPPGAADELTTERLVRLDPTAWCYLPPPNSPDATVEPGASSPVTFGSFNIVAKISERCIAMWSEILGRVESSRLVLKAPALRDAATRQRLKERFASHGITDDRVQYLGPDVQLADHLAAYRRIDVALDTFPYHGTTTTCDALWMGVPVVVLAGDVHVSRVGVSLLSAVGLSDLLATTADAYVALAAQLAKDSDRRLAVSRELRKQMRRSALMDAAGFTRRLEAAYRTMWRTYIAQ